MAVKDDMDYLFSGHAAVATGALSAGGSWRDSSEASEDWHRPNQLEFNPEAPAPEPREGVHVLSMVTDGLSPTASSR